MLQSKIDEIRKRVKVTELSDEVTRQIIQEINAAMIEFSREFARKEAQSIRDTSKIILGVAVLRS